MQLSLIHSLSFQLMDPECYTNYIYLSAEISKHIFLMIKVLGWHLHACWSAMCRESTCSCQQSVSSPRPESYLSGSQCRHIPPETPGLHLEHETSS